jgi:hypothetical protein
MQKTFPLLKAFRICLSYYRQYSRKYIRGLGFAAECNETRTLASKRAEYDKNPSNSSSRN